jgi:hypothetical protein
MTTYMMTAEAVTALQKTLDFITEHPERHDQCTWAGGLLTEDFSAEVEPDLPGGCGTYGCVAGWLAMRNAAAIPEEAWIPIYKYDYELHRYTDEIVGYEFNYNAFPVADIARDVLNVNRDTDRDTDADILVEQLFDSERTLEEIWFVGQQLAEGRLRIPEGIEPKDPECFEFCGCGCED